MLLLYLFYFLITLFAACDSRCSAPSKVCGLSRTRLCDDALSRGTRPDARSDRRTAHLCARRISSQSVRGAPDTPSNVCSRVDRRAVLAQAAVCLHSHRCFLFLRPPDHSHSHSLFSSELLDFYRVWLPWVLRQAARAPLLMNVYFEKHLREDMGELRARLHIEPPPYVIPRARYDPQKKAKQKEKI